MGGGVVLRNVTLSRTLYIYLDIDASMGPISLAEFMAKDLLEIAFLDKYGSVSGSFGADIIDSDTIRKLTLRLRGSLRRYPCVRWSTVKGWAHDRLDGEEKYSNLLLQALHTEEPNPIEWYRCTPALFKSLCLPFTLNNSYSMISLFD